MLSAHERSGSLFLFLTILFSISCTASCTPKDNKIFMANEVSSDLDFPHVQRGTPEFDTFLRDRIYNECISEREKQTPFAVSMIALPQTVAHVQSVLSYAKIKGKSIAVRSGGHNWFGVSLAADVVVDMRKFDSIEIENSCAKVGPAALGQVLNERANKLGLWFPSGHCVGVPLGGYLLGGGFGWFQHANGRGMAAEWIQSMQIVTADGVVLSDINDKNHPDWMWLARGSASMFPGVVLSFTIQLHRLPSILRQQTTFFEIDQYENVVKFLCEQQNLSNRLELSVVPACTPPFLEDLVHGDIPDRVCIANVYVLADDEQEFHTSTSFLQKLLVSIPHLYRTEFQDQTLSEITNAVGRVYPPGLTWQVRSYQVSMKEYQRVDWTALQQTFRENSQPNGLTHILTVIAPDSKLRGGAYGTTLPGIVVGGYCAMNSPDDTLKASSQRMLNTMEEVLKHVVAKYNPLEHPMNETTVGKSFGDVIRLRRLRAKLDPDSLFHDASMIKDCYNR